MDHPKDAELVLRNLLEIVNSRRYDYSTPQDRIAAKLDLILHQLNHPHLYQHSFQLEEAQALLRDPDLPRVNEL